MQLNKKQKWQPNGLVLIWKPIKGSSYRKFCNNFIGPFKVINISRIEDYNYKVLKEKAEKLWSLILKLTRLLRSAVVCKIFVVYFVVYFIIV